MVFCRSYHSSCFNPAMVPALHGPSGDEAAVYLEHLSVHWICRGTGPAEGDDQRTPVREGCAYLLMLPSSLHVFFFLVSVLSSPVSSLSCWTTSLIWTEMGQVMSKILRETQMRIICVAHCNTLLQFGKKESKNNYADVICGGNCKFILHFSGFLY